MLNFIVKSCGRHHSRRYRHKSLVLILCLCLNLLSPEAFAQQSTPAEQEKAELLRRIKTLEDRLEKLETERRTETPDAIIVRPTEVQPPEATTTPVPQTEPDASLASNPPISTAPSSNGFLDFFRTTDVSGFIDTYYTYNFNRPASRTNPLRYFDTRHNQFAFNLAEIAFERTPDAENSRFGFRLDLQVGAAADRLNAFEPGGSEVYKNFQQAYGSYLAPIGKGLQFDIGKFITWSGAENDEAINNWNYSRGLLYTFATPAYHSGLRATYAFNDKVSLMGAVVNGWDNVEDNNAGKTFGLALTLTPTSNLSITPNYIGGAEQTDDTRHKRHLFDTIVSYRLSPRLSVMGDYVYGFDRLPDEGRVHWAGAGAYLRYELTKRFFISPRYELYRDYDGFTTGTAQKLQGITVTGEYRLGENLQTRLEYRRDWSDRFVFEKRDMEQASRNQSTLLAGFIWSFGFDESDAPAPNPATVGLPLMPVARPRTVTRSARLPEQIEPSKAAIQTTSLPTIRTPDNPAQTHTRLANIPITDALPAKNDSSAKISAQGN
ncbi:MAG: outer membrane beta-barrel protein [Pyrinomonadaceae bacterium MAG19_C2-C3]|nr:outer membrane beta-barrel protein [Pyrinomonadaceae bacterium MAG19_C2-C3]